MAQILIINGFFRWNISANVGRMSPNVIDDVELVRFGYFCAGRNLKTPVPDVVVDPLAAMRPAGPYGDDLQAVIDAHQTQISSPPDGRVSVEKPTADATRREFYDGTHVFIMAFLNVSMIGFAGDIYPRLDLHSASGTEISKTVRRLFRLDT